MLILLQASTQNALSQGGGIPTPALENMTGVTTGGNPLREPTQLTAATTGMLLTQQDLGDRLLYAAELQREHIAISRAILSSTLR